MLAAGIIRLNHFIPGICVRLSWGVQPLWGPWEGPPYFCDSGVRIYIGPHFLSQMAFRLPGNAEFSLNFPAFTRDTIPTAQLSKQITKIFNRCPRAPGGQLVCTVSGRETAEMAGDYTVDDTASTLVSIASVVASNICSNEARY